MNQVFIGIGSNLHDPVKQVKLAIEALSVLSHSQLIQVSALYSSQPMGPQDQPDYINAVAELSTELTPLALLDALQAIEQSQGRERKAVRWDARTLDLDILLYANQQIEHERLLVPHYGMAEREFVLYPLAEIAPDLVLPDGRLLRQLLETCPSNGLHPVR
ncbi:2-amino-4-hydroxy-6-hydroxymethyldihydropteridine diphosphokinase [Neptunicella sp. SCSIO 80796]|uniref:2-amino-4-hydroxy-6- hydroxymethyldihydropteridine diphosphokinase n=1 Tax=Neptunicella plasticusilytica TaxID=3117012 RepID=UPI003A4D5D33